MNSKYLHFHKWIIFFAAVSITFSTSAQTDSVQTAEDYYNQGLATYDFTHRKLAKDLFILALQHNPRHAKAQFMAGKSIMLTINKHEALDHFLEAVKLDPMVDKDVFQYIGMAYHHSSQYDKAIEYYKLHRKRLIRSLDFERSKNINEIDRKIFECQNAKIYESHPVNVTITNLGKNINSDYPDYAPAISADESTLVFTSRRDDNINPDLAEDHEYFEDIFIAHSENGVFKKSENMGRPINSLFHNASISISPDGSELFLYNSINGGDIYETDLQKDGSWSKPAPISGEINTPYLENSVSVTEDLQTLFFTSNKPGGYGGTDIYMSKIGRNKSWGEPVNLGPDVNTEMDEDGVFISANGKHLYFSSNGHAGMGDLDIYRSEIQEDGSWSIPINLGYPINSVENDIYFTLSGDEKHAYYSSVRDVTQGEQDIYKVDMTNFEPITIEEIIRREDQNDPIASLPDSSLVRINMSILSSQDNIPLNASVQVTRKSTGQRLVPSHIDSGKYMIEFYIKNSDKYDVSISKESFESHRYPIYIMGSGKGEQEFSETIKLKPKGNSNINLINVYFAHDSDTPNGFEGVQYLEMMLKNEPNLDVEISGHTDNTGIESYNKDLSLRRAKAVKRYLVNSGIDGNRITTVGHGAERPISSNESAVGRKLNRRTEFKVKGRLDGQVESEF